jgi:hypothetical protein
VNSAKLADLKHGCLQSTELTAQETTLHKDCDRSAGADCSAAPPVIDSGLECLITLAHFHQLSASPHQLKHQFAMQRFDTPTLVRAGRDLRLQPGMSVTAEIKTGQRRLIEFFLSPLLRYKQESLGER